MDGLAGRNDAKTRGSDRGMPRTRAEIASESGSRGWTTDLDGATDSENREAGQGQEHGLAEADFPGEFGCDRHWQYQQTSELNETTDGITHDCAK
jgi:hypothetical protein